MSTAVEERPAIAAARLAHPAKPSTPKALPKPDSDFYQLAETLSVDEFALLKQVRAFMDTKVAPIINADFRRAKSTDKS